MQDATNSSRRLQLQGVGEVEPFFPHPRQPISSLLRTGQGDLTALTISGLYVSNRTRERSFTSPRSICKAHLKDKNTLQRLTSGRGFLESAAPRGACLWLALYGFRPRAMHGTHGQFDLPANAAETTNTAGGSRFPRSPLTRSLPLQNARIAAA